MPYAPGGGGGAGAPGGGAGAPGGGEVGGGELGGGELGGGELGGGVKGDWSAELSSAGGGGNCELIISPVFLGRVHHN